MKNEEGKRDFMWLLMLITPNTRFMSKMLVRSIPTRFLQLLLKYPHL